MLQFNTLRDALVCELADLYSAETQISKNLSKVASTVTNASLRSAIEHHLMETKKQISRLDEVFTLMGIPAQTETCEAMEGLMEEIEEVLGASGDPQVKDAVIIGALQRVEHYEMAGYGTARAFAKQLGEDAVVKILQETLDEEGAANKKLSGLAEGGLISGGVNQDANKRAGNM